MTEQLAELMARRFAILGEPTRLRLLDALHARDEASVGELADAVGGSHANVSKHLNVLLAEGMVGRRRDGSHARYRIADPTLLRLCDEVCAGVRDRVRDLANVVQPQEALR